MRFLAILLLTTGAMSAQAPKSIVGTLTAFRSESAEVEIRPDRDGPVIARITADTIAQKIAPGAKDLKSAEGIAVTDLGIGDRVLVTLAPGTSDALRIVVMAAGDIAKRDAADRQDWQKRGVAGIVSAKAGNRITVKTKTFTGEVEAVIAVDEQTSFKRYAPDSVKFSDARPSKLSEVAVGDQLRARGTKSDDGLQVAAKDVAFGTFLVKAGAVSAVNLESRQVTVKELGTNKTLTVLLTADSQIKLMPSVPMPGAAASGGGRSGLPAMPGRGGPSGGFDINQMLERMPASKLEDLKPGSSVVISSTKGATRDQLTAIMVLGNADMLIQMASMMSNSNRGGGMGGMAMGGASMGGMPGGDSSGLGGLGLSGMIMQ
jgi:hypothetical protein